MKVNHKEVRVLRETLSRVFHKSHPVIQKEIIQALKLYALNVGPYCEHVDRVLVPANNKEVCLDCGAMQNKNDFKLINGKEE